MLLLTIKGKDVANSLDDSLIQYVQKVYGVSMTEEQMNDFWSWYEDDDDVFLKTDKRALEYYLKHRLRN